MWHGSWAGAGAGAATFAPTGLVGLAAGPSRRYGSPIDPARLLRLRLGKGWCPVVRYDAASFTAGEDAATRVASCVARLAARDLMEGSRWWNRWRRGAMSSALIACADELERDADLRAANEVAR